MKSPIFRQLQDSRSSTFTYLLADADTGQAVVIDPVFEQARRDAALIRELDLRLMYTLDTHVHADHVTGASRLKSMTGSLIGISAASGASGADLPLHDRDRIEFGERFLEVRSTPGHTVGCVSFVLDDQSMVFTGDALLIRGAGRTDFQQGDAVMLYRSIRQELFTLPDDCMVYPAHDYRGLTASSIGEEKAFNPRVGVSCSEADFVGFQQNLGLPHPKQIDIAVPANLKCGQTESTVSESTPDWAPLRYTYAGIDEVDAEWVAEHGSDVRIIDVRDMDEYSGILGHISGATLLPLAELREHLDQLSRDTPTILVCRSGARSAQAVTILRNAGFTKAANLAGGMIAWNNQRLPVER